MIEVVPGFPDGVVAISAKGRVTRADYETVLVPAVDRALAAHGRVCLWYEIGAEFTEFDAGAMWEDFKVGLRHLTRWERIAVVTDVDWLRLAVNAFSLLIPAEIRVFANADADGARKWVIAGCR